MKSLRPSDLCWLGSVILMGGLGAAEVAYVDRPFGQEVAIHYTASDGLPQGTLVTLALERRADPLQRRTTERRVSMPVDGNPLTLWIMAYLK